MPWYFSPLQPPCQSKGIYIHQVHNWPSDLRFFTLCTSGKPLVSISLQSTHIDHWLMTNPTPVQTTLITAHCQSAHINNSAGHNKQQVWRCYQTLPTTAGLNRQVAKPSLDIDQVPSVTWYDSSSSSSLYPPHRCRFGLNPPMFHVFQFSQPHSIPSAHLSH